MPRRRGPGAQASIAQERQARWRYLLRHPDFRADLREVLRLHHEDERGNRNPRFDEAGLKLSQFVRKWPITGVPQHVLYPRHDKSLPAEFPALNIENIAFYERLFESDMLPIGHPVVGVSSGDEDQDWRNLAAGKMMLMLDVNFPMDLILAEVEAAIRQESETRSSLLKPRLRATKRQRPEKADSYLAVYDAAEQGKTFTAIAKALKKRPSTVKSIFLAARRNIFGPVAGPSIRALPLADFDPKTHMATCAKCIAAPTFKDMCKRAQRYAMQDEKGQREKTGFDETRYSGSSSEEGD